MWVIRGEILGQTDILGEFECHHSQGRHTWVIRDITDQNRQIGEIGTSQIIVNIPLVRLGRSHRRQITWGNTGSSLNNIYTLCICPAEDPRSKVHTPWN